MTPHPTEAERRKLEALIRSFDDHQKYCEQSLVIRNQAGVPVPFRTFPGPAKLDTAIRKQRAKGKPVRIIYLKARRVYVSAAIATQIFKHVAHWPGRHAAVIAHKVDSASEIFSYYTDFNRWYQPFHGILLDPLADAGNATGRMLKWSNDSWVRVLAGLKDVGRSMGIHALHVSEAAFIRNLRSVMLGLLNTMGDQLDTMAFKESTANGASGEFYEDWQDASDPKSGSDWEPVFLGWNEHPTNRMELSVEPGEFDRSMSGEERGLQRTYQLTFEQLNWRRWTIINKCGRSAKLFAQEHPICPEEAFLLSGRPRFDHISLGRMPLIREPLRGDLRRIDVGTRERLMFEPRADGDVIVYRKPQAGTIYTAGADNMSGKDPNFMPGETDSDPDYCSCSVLDATTGEQVCKARGRWTPAHFAELVYAIGQWYGWAYLVPEANNHGQSLIDNLLRLNYPLDRIHVKRRIPGDRRPVMLHEIGFETNATTRPQLISALEESINTMAVIVRDANTLKELRGFVIWPDGVPRAQSGKGNHDDDVISLALANIGLRYAPRVSQQDMRTPAKEQANRKTAEIVRYGLGRRQSMREDD